MCYSGRCQFEDSMGDCRYAERVCAATRAVVDYLHLDQCELGGATERELTTLDQALLNLLHTCANVQEAKNMIVDVYGP